MENSSAIPRAALAHLLCMTGIYFCSGAFLMQFPRYVLTLGGTAEQAGWILAVGLLPVLLLSSSIGDWVRRIGARTPAQLGAGIAAVASVLMLSVHEVGPWIFVVRLLYAVGHSIMFVMLFTSAAMLVDNPVQRAQIIGWLAVVIQLGNALGGWLGEVAFHAGTSAFWLSSAAIAAVAGVLGRWAPVPAAPLPSPPNAAAPAAGGGWPIELWALVAVGMAFAGLSQFMPVFIEHLARSGQVQEPFAAAWFITPALLVVAAVRLLGGYFAARLLRPPVLIACHALLLVTIVLLPWIDTRGHAIALALIFGLSYGWLYPALSALAFSRVSAENRGRVAGRMVNAFEIGFRLGPIGLGALITHAGYTAMFIGLALAYLAILGGAQLFARWGKEKYGYAG